jgi:hypothetical protein
MAPPDRVKVFNRARVAFSVFCVMSSILKTRPCGSDNLLTVIHYLLGELLCRHASGTCLCGTEYENNCGVELGLLWRCITGEGQKLRTLLSCCKKIGVMQNSSKQPISFPLSNISRERKYFRKYAVSMLSFLAVLTRVSTQLHNRTTTPSEGSFPWAKSKVTSRICDRTPVVTICKQHHDLTRVVLSYRQGKELWSFDIHKCDTAMPTAAGGEGTKQPCGTKS